jgi:hypothetical protein
MDTQFYKRINTLRDKLPSEFHGEFIAICYDLAIVILSRSENKELSDTAKTFAEKVENET